MLDRWRGSDSHASWMQISCKMHLMLLFHAPFNLDAVTAFFDLFPLCIFMGEAVSFAVVHNGIDKSLPHERFLD